MAVLLCWVGLSDVESANLWPNKSGELCWRNLNTGATVKLAVTRTVGRHYLVHGAITNDPGGPNEYIQCLNGNAEIINGQVIMHYNTSGFDANEAYVASGRVEFDLIDLHGWAEGVFISCDKNSGICSARYDGQYELEYISCP
jgi:hypothetical protein